MDNHMIDILLFRVATRDILEELKNRADFHERSEHYKNFSSKELLEYILKNRMNVFED